MTNAGLLVAVLVVPLLAALLSLVLKPRWLYGVAAIFEAATLGIALTLITLAVQGPALDCCVRGRSGQTSCASTSWCFTSSSSP